MSVRILVIDAYDKPVSNAEVIVKWSDGLSTVRTNSAGIADTGLKGSIVYVSVYGKEQPCYNAYYSDETIPIKI